MGFKLSQAKEAPLESPDGGIIAPEVKKGPGLNLGKREPVAGLPEPKDDIEAAKLNSVLDVARGLPVLKSLQKRKGFSFSQAKAVPEPEQPKYDPKEDVAKRVIEAREYRQGRKDGTIKEPVSPYAPNQPRPIDLPDAAPDQGFSSRFGSVLPTQPSTNETVDQGFESRFGPALNLKAVSSKQIAGETMTPDEEFVKKALDQVPFVKDAGDAARGIRAYRAYSNIESGEGKPEDAAELADFIASQEKESELWNEKNLFWKGVEIASQIPRYGAEIAITGGSAGVGKTMLSQASKQGFKQFLKKVAARVGEEKAKKTLLASGARFVGKNLAVSAKAALRNPAGILADTMKSHLPSVNDAGNLEEGDSLLKSAASGFAGRTIETLTERMGPMTLGQAGRFARAAVPSVIDDFLVDMASKGSQKTASALRSVGKQISRVPGVDSAKQAMFNVGGKLMKPVEVIDGLHKYAKKYVVDRYKGMAPRAFKEVMKGASWHGLIGESLEERYGEAMRAALDAIGFETGDESQYVNNQLYAGAREFFNGNPEEAWNQVKQALGTLAAEGIGFMPFSAASGAANIYGAAKGLPKTLKMKKAEHQSRMFHRDVRKEFEAVNKAMEAKAEQNKSEYGNKAGLPHGTAFVGPENDVFAVEGNALVHYDPNGDKTGEVYDLDQEPPKELTDRLQNYNAHHPKDVRPTEEIDRAITDLRDAAQSWMGPEEFSAKYDQLVKERRASVIAKAPKPPAPEPKAEKPRKQKPEAAASAQAEPVAPVAPEPESVGAPAPVEAPKKPDGHPEPGTKVKVKSYSGKDFGANEIAGYEEVDGKIKVIFKNPLPTGADRSFIEGVNLSPIGDEGAKETPAAESAPPAQPKAEVPPAEQAATGKQAQVVEAPVDESPAKKQAPAVPDPKTTGQQIADALRGIGSGVKDAAQKKIDEYANKILAGESPDAVMQGLKPNGATWTAVMDRVNQLGATGGQNTSTPGQVEATPSTGTDAKEEPQGGLTSVEEYDAAIKKSYDKRKELLDKGDTEGAQNELKNAKKLRKEREDLVKAGPKKEEPKAEAKKEITPRMRGQLLHLNWTREEIEKLTFDQAADAIAKRTQGSAKAGAKKEEPNEKKWETEELSEDQTVALVKSFITADQEDFDDVILDQIRRGSDVAKVVSEVFDLFPHTQKRILVIANIVRQRHRQLLAKKEEKPEEPKAKTKEDELAEALAEKNDQLRRLGIYTSRANVSEREEKYELGRIEKAYQDRVAQIEKKHAKPEEAKAPEAPKKKLTQEELEALLEGDLTSAAKKEEPKKRSMNDRPGKRVGTRGQTALPSEEMEEAASDAEYRDETVLGYEKAAKIEKLSPESRKDLIEAFNKLVRDATDFFGRFYENTAEGKRLLATQLRNEMFGKVDKDGDREVAHGKDLSKLVGESGNSVGDFYFIEGLTYLVDRAVEKASGVKQPAANKEQARRVMIAMSPYRGELNRSAMLLISDLVTSVYAKAVEVVSNLKAGKLSYEGNIWDAAHSEVANYIDRNYPYLDKSDTVEGTPPAFNAQDVIVEDLSKDSVMEAMKAANKPESKGPVFSEPKDRKLGEKKPPKQQPKPRVSTGNAEIDDMMSSLLDDLGDTGSNDSLKSIREDMGDVDQETAIKNLMAPTGMRKGAGDWYEFRDAFILRMASDRGSRLSVSEEDGRKTWTLKGPKGDLVLHQKSWTTLGDIVDQLKKTGAMSDQEEEFLSRLDRSIPVSLTARGSDTSNIANPGTWRALWHSTDGGMIHMSLETLVGFHAFIPTLAHEAWHHQTVHAITWVLAAHGKGDPEGTNAFMGWQDLGDEELNDKINRLRVPVANLIGLYKATLEAARDQKDSPSYTVNRDYWATSLEEFIAEVGSNRSLQDWMAKQTISKGLGRKQQTLLDRFVQIICDIIGLDNSEESHNLLVNTLREMAALSEEQKSWKRSPGTGVPLTLAHRDPRSMDHKKVTERIAELTEAAQALKAGDASMTREIYDQLVNKHKPVYPYATVPAPAPKSEMQENIQVNRKDRVGVIDSVHTLGDWVKLRLDIPAYRDHGTWIVAVHPSSANDNASGVESATAFENHAIVNNPTFVVGEPASLNIAAGIKSKNPIATIKGQYEPSKEAEALREADEALRIANEDVGLDNPRWAQVGMDPERHSYFYDRHTTEPVVSGTRAIQIGPLVLVENPVYGRKENFLYSESESKRDLSGLSEKHIKVVAKITSKAVADPKLAIRSLDGLVRMFRNSLGDKITLHLAPGIEFAWERVAAVYEGDFSGVGDTVAATMRNQDLVKDQENVPEDAEKDSAGEGEPGVPDGSKESDSDVSEKSDGNAPERDSEREADNQGPELPGDPGAAPEGNAVSGGTDSAGNGTSGVSPGSESGMGQGESAEQGGEEAPSRVSEPALNHEIKDEDVIVPGGAKLRAKANVEAIKLLKVLESENRLATPEEKKILAQFTGWGGLTGYFNDVQAWNRNRPAGASWNETYGELYDEIKKLLTEDEWNAAEISTANAHYTDREVVKAIWRIAEHLGFKGGRYLEPGAGIGNFAGLMPSSLRAGSKGIMVERDEMSHRLLKKLYPENEIVGMDMADAKIVPHSVDIAVGNVPFGQEVPSDSEIRYGMKLNIHNYFIARSIDAVKPGGLVILVTSHGTMDSNPEQAKFLASKADLIGAIRLPRDAFTDNAGTQVVTDIVIFRKPFGPAIQGESWVDKFVVEGLDKEGKAHKDRITEYYKNHPEMALGVHDFKGSMYKANEYSMASTPGKLADKIDKAMQNLPRDILSEKAAEGAVIEEEGPKTPPEGTLELIEGRLHVIHKRKPTEVIPGKSAKIEGYPHKLFAADTQSVAKSYIEVRGALRKVVETMTNPEATDEQVKEAQEELNKQYENFIGSHGYINFAKNINALESDPEFYRVMSIENVKASWNNEVKALEYRVTKGDIFSKRVLGPRTPPISVPTVRDGIIVSMGFRGVIDPKYIAVLTGMSEEEVIDAFAKDNLAFRDPVSGNYIHSDLYLSGNVREKLLKARVAVGDSKEYERNVKALEEVQPKRIPLKDISVRLGESWIPKEVYQEFAKRVFRPLSPEVDYMPLTETWVCKRSKKEKKKDCSADTTDFAVKKGNGRLITGLEVLQYALNMAVKPKITYQVELDDGSKRTVDDENASNEVSLKIDELNKLFTAFVMKPGGYHGELVEEAWNVTTNHTVELKHSGAHVTLPGSSSEIVMRPYQKAAIARFTLEGSGMLAHAVGAGKTYTMIGTAMEMKRLGIAKRPVIVVQNATLGQFSTSFMKMYPGANVLVASTDDLGAGRHQFLARMQTGNWDAIVMAQSTFNLLECNEETQKEHIRNRIAELRLAHEAAIRDKEPETSIRVRDIVNAITNLTNKLNAIKKKKDEEDAKAAASGRRKVERIFWEDLGVDALLVDEAHAYKKPPFVTKLGNIVGLQKQISDIGEDLFMKTRQVQAVNRGRGIVFATGTPVTNTLGEIWHMMNFINPKKNEEFGVRTFDEFVSKFAVNSPVVERNAGGEPKLKEGLTRFVNGYEFLSWVRSTFDILTPDELREFLMEYDADGKPKESLVPGMKGGDIIKIVVPSTPFTEDFKDYILETYDAYQAITGPAKRAFNWVPVQLYTASKYIAIDPRLVYPTAKENPNGKINALLAEAMKEYRESADRKGTQLIFSDLFNFKKKNRLEEFFPNPVPPEMGDRDVSGDDAFLFREIKKKLIEMGVPEEEIEIIDDHKKEDREALFDRVQTGEVRFIMGSTDTLGTGVNVQNRVTAIHHLDIPWMPASLEQRNGRGLRFGNMFHDKGVGIYMYATESTIDSALITKLVRKAKAIHQVMGGKLEGRSFDDPASEVAISMEEMAAIAEGDDNFFKKIELDKIRRDLETTRDSLLSAQTRARSYIKEATLDIASLEHQVKSGKEAKERIESMGVPHGECIINGKMYDLNKKDELEAAQTEIDKLMREHRANVKAQTEFGSLESYTPSHYSVAPKGNTSRAFSINGLEVKYVYGATVYTKNGEKTVSSGVGRFNVYFPGENQNLYTGEAETLKGLLDGIGHIKTVIDNNVRQAEESIKNKQGEIDRSKETIAKTWDKGPQLEQVEKELEEVERALLASAARKAAERAARRKAREDGDAGSDDGSGPGAVPAMRKLGGKRLAQNSPSILNSVDSYTNDPEVDFSEARIIASWADMFNVKLSEGFIKERAQGIYKYWLTRNGLNEKGPGVVRIRPAHFNIYVASHEIAHHIDIKTATTASLIQDAKKGIGYDSHGRPVTTGTMKYTAADIVKELKKISYTKSVNNRTMVAEGFAETLRHYITEDDLKSKSSKLYDWFTTIWMRDNPKLAEKIKDARTMAHDFAYQGVMQRARSIFQPIQHSQPVSEWWDNLRNHWTTVVMDRFIDDTYMVGKIDERLKDEAGFDPKKEGTASLRDFMIGYNMTARARASAALEVGVFSVRLGEQKQLGQAGGYWKGIRDNIKNDEEYAEASAFALARHTIYLETVAKVDFNTGMTLEHALDVYNKVKADKGKFDRYEKFAKHISNYANDQLNMLVDAGALSSKDRDNMVKFYGDHYFPLHRQVRPQHSMFGSKEETPSSGSGKKYVNLGPAVKSRSATGSSAPLYDPSVAIMERSVRFYDRAAKTRVIHAIVGRLDPMFTGGVSHMGDLVDRVPPGKRLTKARLSELLRQLVQSGIVTKGRARLAIIAWKILHGKPVSYKDKAFFRKKTKMKGRSDAEYKAAAKKLPNIESEISIWRDNLTPNAKKATVIVHDLNGKPIMYQVDKHLYEVLTGLDEGTVGMFTKLFSVANQMFRTGAINLNPAFGLYNITADMPNYMVSGKDSTWYNRVVSPMAAVLGISTSKLQDTPVLGKFVRVMAEIMTKIVDHGRSIAGMPPIEGTNLQMVRSKDDVVVRYYELLGGGLYSPVGGSYQSHQKTVRRQLFTIRHKRKGLLAHGKDIYDEAAYKAGNILDAMQATISVTDMFPRIGQFEKTMNAHGYFAKGDHWVDSSGAVAIPPEHVQISAIVAAGNSTTNFKVAGRWGRKINTYLSLWNPSVQATYRYLRLLYNLKNIKNGSDDERLEAQKTMMMMVATAVASMMYWLWRHNDSDYQNQTPDVKEKWLTLGWGGKTFVKIAKVPMDHNGLIWNLTAAGLDTVFGDPAKDSKLDDVIINFIEDQIPTGGGLGRTAIETFVADYDYYRKTDLTPNYLQNAPKQNQYTEYTLGTSKVIASMLGYKLSPIQVDHFLNGVTGGMYRRVMDTAETIGSMKVPRYNQLPLLRGMFPDRHASQPINDLYKRSGDLDHIVQLPYATKEDRAEKQRLDQYIELMHDIRALEYQKNKNRRNFEYQKYLVGLANEAMGLREQKDNPAPYGTEVPSDIKKVVFDFSMRKAKLGMMMSDYPHKPEKGKTMQETMDDYLARQKSAETWLSAHSKHDQVYSAIQEVRKSKSFNDLIEGKREPSSWEERQIWREKRDKARIWKY